MTAPVVVPAHSIPGRAADFPATYGDGVARRWIEHALHDTDGEAPQVTIEWAVESGDGGGLAFACWFNDAWDGDSWEPSAPNGRDDDTGLFVSGNIKWDGCSNVEFPKGAFHVCGGGLKGGWARMAAALEYLRARIAEVHPGTADVRAEWVRP